MPRYFVGPENSVVAAVRHKRHWPQRWICANARWRTVADKLCKAAGVRLPTEMSEGLRAGKRYQFGDAVRDDRGTEFTKAHFLGADERVRAAWSELHIWSGNGSCYIGVKSDKKAYLALPYQAANNARILEAAMRMKFKHGGDLSSGILNGN